MQEQQAPGTRAVQYVRMSTEHQRYSIENQSAAIAEYAERHSYRVVATYTDAGRSGLTLKGRAGLQRLLSDALSPDRRFDAILVLDVSRWGRFQDPDQAAHYEYICRAAGVQIHYCTEPFENDLSPTTTIMKHLKRVMAGEYSRELSVKSSRAHVQQARLGFRQGGSLVYGFRRQLINANGEPLAILKPGQMKALSTDHVIAVPGPPEEIAVIRRIFRMYVRHRMSTRAIAEKLCKEGIPGRYGAPFSANMVRSLLHSELCIGRYVYNRTSGKLKTERRRNPEHLWVRSDTGKPVVSEALFREAQNAMASRRRVVWTDKALLGWLSALTRKHGFLSHRIIATERNGPSANTIAKRFGSLEEALAMIGWQQPVWPVFGMNSRHWTDEAILDGLRRLHDSQGFLSTRTIDAFDGLPSNVFIRQRFGSMRRARELAGLPTPTHSDVQRAAQVRRVARGERQRYAGKLWTDEALLAALRTLYRAHGYLTGNLIDKAPDVPSHAYFAKRLGSLTRAYELAGLPKTSLSEKVSAGKQRKKEGLLVGRQKAVRRGGKVVSNLLFPRKQILSGLHRLYQDNGFLSAVLIDSDPELPSYGTVIRQFGSLLNAYHLAGWHCTMDQLVSAKARRRLTKAMIKRGGDPATGTLRSMSSERPP